MSTEEKTQVEASYEDQRRYIDTDYPMATGWERRAPIYKLDSKGNHVATEYKPDPFQLK